MRRTTDGRQSDVGNHRISGRWWADSKLRKERKPTETNRE